LPGAQVRGGGSYIRRSAGFGSVALYGMHRSQVRMGKECWIRICCPDAWGAGQRGGAYLHSEERWTRVYCPVRYKEKQATHTNTQQEQHTTQRTTRQEQHHTRPHEEPPPPPPPLHLTTIERGAATMRTTSHTRVGGRAEVSVGGRVEVGCALVCALGSHLYGMNGA